MHELQTALELGKETAKSLRDPSAREFIESLGGAIAETKGMFGRALEHLFRKSDHDFLFFFLPDGSEGAIYLTEWQTGWSVKWYSMDRSRQVTLVDGVDENVARGKFEALRIELALASGRRIEGHLPCE